MRGLAPWALALVVACLGGGYAAACEDVFPTSGRQQQSAKDCSFKNFGADRNYSGFPVRDLGNGRVGQRLIAKPQCDYREKLLVVDCRNAEMVIVDGVMSPEDVAAEKRGAVFLGSSFEIKYIQPPYGPIAIQPATTVADIAQIAKKAGLTYSLNPRADFAQHNTGVLATIAWYIDGGADWPPASVVRYSKTAAAARPFDMACGCRVFYPDLPGATQ